MKKLILFLCINIISIFYSNFLFADSGSLNDVKLSVSENTVKIDEKFNLDFTINLGDTGNIGDITINGIDNFKSLGESSSFSFQDINGVKKGVYNMTVSLKPINVGTFSIGPAIIKLGDKTIQSNIIEINVIGNNSIASGTLLNTGSTDEMQELHDIKGPKSYFNFSFWFILTFLVFLFFIGYHYLLKYYISSKDDSVPKKIIAEKPKDKKVYFLEKLDLVEDKIKIYDKSEFFASVNDFLREYVEYKGLAGATKMTFKEFDKHKNQIDIQLFKIIQNTYFEEFRENESISDRKEIIESIRNILKKS